VKKFSVNFIQTNSIHPPMERTRKVRDKPQPYIRSKKKAAAPKDPNAFVAKTSAAPPEKKKRENLTLQDWFDVFLYIDEHPLLDQTEIVKHFSTRAEGKLIFTQPTLSRKIKERPILEARANDNPTALSSKRPRVVTRPDVEKALVVWFRAMESKGETVSGPMLMEKRKRFEAEFKVPEKERIAERGGWVASFCKT
jgi:hypothetical protein